jgi:hypothetical protein
VAKRKEFETKLDDAIKKADLVVKEATGLRADIAKIDADISVLKTKIGTATVGFEAEKKTLAEFEQKRQSLVNKELYIRANENPDLAITRIEQEILGNRQASGATMATNVADSLASAQKMTERSLQELKASDKDGTNPVTQQQIADIEAKKIAFDSSANQLLLINEYKKYEAALLLKQSSTGETSSFVIIPSSKYTKPIDLSRAIVASGNVGAQQLKQAGYPEQAKKLLADSIARANAVYAECNDKCGY